MPNPHSMPEIIEFWRNIFLSENPLQALEKIEGKLPLELNRFIDLEHSYPEPYFGPLDDIHSNDAILLLINPGNIQVAQENIKEHNDFIRERFLSWNRHDYLNCEERLHVHSIAGLQWRNAMQEQMERVLDRKIEFLHTIEFFPFHSKSWGHLSKRGAQYLLEMGSTKASMNLIRQLSLSKHRIPILGIGRPWLDVFEKFNHPCVDEYSSDPGNPRAGHRVYKINVTEEGTPVVIYSSCGMHFPRAIEPVKKIREFCGLL
ncbi:hypothetical protein LH433_09610 [Laribacter hongkongensis]|uniref:hypothetical protein n=1 Tax=Laribacter hongkongensis TaxID=168471 RepID=UPI001EFCEDC6|nr:hypothetical protein [Laribacter hongkongensis]MCG9107002.1 hypothetical protein [Laribacter hongkongensis]